jgi:hypothetical protein
MMFGSAFGKTREGKEGKWTRSILSTREKRGEHEDERSQSSARRVPTSLVSCK